MKIQLSESELRTMIMEAVEEAMDEQQDEWGNIFTKDGREDWKDLGRSVAGAAKGAYKGYTSSKAMSDTSERNRYNYARRDGQQGLGYKDTIKQIKQMYDMAREYQTKANQLRSRAEQMKKYANISQEGNYASGKPGSEAEFSYRDKMEGGGVGGAFAGHRNNGNAGSQFWDNATETNPTRSQRGKKFMGGQKETTKQNTDSQTKEYRKAAEEE